MNIGSLLTISEQKEFDRNHISNLQSGINLYKPMSPNSRLYHSEAMGQISNQFNQNNNSNNNTNNDATISPQSNNPNLLKFTTYTHQPINFLNNMSQQPLSPNSNNFINGKSKSFDNIESPILSINSSPSNSSVSSGPPSPHNYNNNNNNFTQLKSPSKSNQFNMSSPNNIPKVNVNVSISNNNNINIPPLQLQSLSNLQNPNKYIQNSQIMYNDNISPHHGSPNRSPNRSSSPISQSPTLSPNQRFSNGNGNLRSSDYNYNQNGNNYNNNYNDNEKVKKRRTRLKKEQTRVLKEFFDKEEYPTKEDKERLSIMLKMSYNTVTTWFSNKRQDKKRKTTDTGGRRIPVNNGQDDEYDDDDDSSDEGNYNSNGNISNGNNKTDLTPILNGVNFNNGKKYHPYNSPNHCSPRSSANNTPLKSNSYNAQIPPFALQSKINRKSDDEFEIDEGNKTYYDSDHSSSRSSPNLARRPNNIIMNQDIILSDDDHFADNDENNSISTLKNLSKSRHSDEELDNTNNINNSFSMTKTEFLENELKKLKKKYN